MSSERNLASTREDTQATQHSVVSAMRLEHENCLGQVHLTRDLHHAFVADTFGFRKHGQRISRKRVVCEYVEASGRRGASIFYDYLDDEADPTLPRYGTDLVQVSSDTRMILIFTLKNECKSHIVVRQGQSSLALTTLYLCSAGKSHVFLVSSAAFYLVRRRWRHNCSRGRCAFRRKR